MKKVVAHIICLHSKAFHSCFLLHGKMIDLPPPIFERTAAVLHRIEAILYKIIALLKRTLTIRYKTVMLLYRIATVR